MDHGQFHGGQELDHGAGNVEDGDQGSPAGRNDEDRLQTKEREKQDAHERIESVCTVTTYGGKLRRDTSLLTSGFSVATLWKF